MKEWSALAAKDPFARQSAPRILHYSFVLVLPPDRRGKNPPRPIAVDPFQSILFPAHRADQTDNVFPNRHNGSDPLSTGALPNPLFDDAYPFEFRIFPQ